MTTAAMSLVLTVWSLLRDRAGRRVMSRGFVPLLVALPWIVFTSIFTMSIIVSSHRTNQRWEEEGGTRSSD